MAPAPAPSDADARAARLVPSWEAGKQLTSIGAAISKSMSDPAVSVQKIQAALDRAEQVQAHASSRHLEAVRLTAAHLIADSSKHFADQVRMAGSAVRGQLQHVARELVLAAEAAAAEAARQRRASQRAAIAALASACLVIGMAVATWLGRS